MKATTEEDNQECVQKRTKVWRSLLPAVLGGDKAAVSTTQFNRTTGVQRILYRIKSSLRQSSEGLTIRKGAGWREEYFKQTRKEWVS